MLFKMCIYLLKQVQLNLIISLLKSSQDCQILFIISQITVYLRGFYSLYSV